MLRIVLCDDNNRAINQYANLIHRIAEKHQMSIEISCFNSGEALLFQYSDAVNDVDIIYLDIFMDNTDGMETARKLRNCGCKAQIIFLTSFEDYVFEAFDVNAVHYLLKEDTSTSKFEDVFLKAVELASKQENELFSYEFNGSTGAIPINEISYFEIWGRVVTVHYGKEKTAKFYGNMERLENNLCGKNFVRSHRSFLVHLSYIAMFQSQSLLLKTGEIVPIGVTYAKCLKESFAEYLSCFNLYSNKENDI